MMRTTNLLILFIVGIAMPLAGSLAEGVDRSRQQLDGWGPFRFSMRRTEAIEAVKPHAQLGNKTPRILYLAIINEQIFEARIDFTSDNNAIALIELSEASPSQDRSVASSPDSCFNSRRPYERGLAEYYGTPDRTTFENDGSSRAQITRFEFKDGGLIQLKAVHLAPAAWEAKAHSRCFISIIYTPGRSVPRATF